MSPLEQYFHLAALRKRMAKQKQAEAAAKDEAPADKAPTVQETPTTRKRPGK